MRIIEPCCYHKQLEGMIDECSKQHTAANFFSFSDWDMCDLLGTLSGYCSGGEMGIVMVRLDVKPGRPRRLGATSYSFACEARSHQSVGPFC